MENKMVYVLKVQSEHEEYPTSSEIIGVYSDKEHARKQMKEYFDEELEEWKSEYDYHDDDLELQKGSDICSIFDKVNGIRYTEFVVDEFEVED